VDDSAEGLHHQPTRSHRGWPIKGVGAPREILERKGEGGQFFGDGRSRRGRIGGAIGRAMECPPTVLGGPHPTKAFGDRGIVSGGRDVGRDDGGDVEGGGLFHFLSFIFFGFLFYILCCSTNRSKAAK
jgi:hypothetical protein